MSWTGAFGLVAVVITGLALHPIQTSAASIRQDANGFVVMEAEDFDLNLTQDNGQWAFDNTPPAWAQTNSGWGYMKGLGAGGIDMSTSPRLDFKIKFNVTGPNYLWVLGSDVSSKDITIGLDGTVTTNSINIGGGDGAFGARNQGEWFWSGTNNAGSGWVIKSFLNVTSAVDHTVNVFFGGGMLVDKIVLTTNAAWQPTPFNYAAQGVPDGNATNIPLPVIVGSPLLSVAMTQPADGKVFTSNTNLVVSVAAKPVTNGNATVTRIEFFAYKQPSGPYTKIGERTTKPNSLDWSNPPVGIFNLTAVVTDTRPVSNVKTSAVVTVEVKAPPSYTTPLIWTTNNFDTGLGTWTLGKNTHASGFFVVPWYFSLDWTNTSFAGGSPGELGVHAVRFNTVPGSEPPEVLGPYIGERLGRRVSLNEELWMRGRVYCRNFGPDGGTEETRISANADVFIGYFDSTVVGDPDRLGMKIREPNNTYPAPGPWRLWAGQDGQGAAEFDTLYTAPETNAFEFEFHWVPDGTGDGAGTFSGWIFSPSQPILEQHYGPRPVTYDAFGFVCPAQGQTEPWRTQEHYLDDFQYLVPAVQKLDIRLLDSTKTLLSWAIPDHILQYADGAIPISHTNAAWVDINTNSVANVGGRYYYTNVIGASTRWFQLRHPLQ